VREPASRPRKILEGIFTRGKTLKVNYFLIDYGKSRRTYDEISDV
jgi:hypothetical protein